MDRFSNDMHKLLEGAAIAPDKRNWDKIDSRLRRARTLALTARWTTAVAAMLAGIFALRAVLPAESISIIETRHESLGESLLAVAQPQARVNLHEFPSIRDLQMRQDTDSQDTETTGTAIVIKETIHAGNTPKVQRDKDTSPDIPENLSLTEEDTADAPITGGRSGKFTLGALVSPSATNSSHSPKTGNIKFSSMNMAPAITFNHDIPVTYGLSVGYDISKRWSIYTGVNYTMYSSKATIASETISQKLHYLSVPLDVKFNFTDSRFIRVYALAGGSVDKCVSGTRTYISPKGSKNGEKASIPEVEFSAYAGVGLMFKITEFLSLYAEPQYIHYFNRNSAHTSYRNANPDAFNVSVGLRFTI